MTIAFCCDVQHCKDLSGAFKSLGIESSPIFGDMQPCDRKNTLDDFKCGKIQVVTSCGVLTEGYDEPTVNAVIMARPTKSSCLFTQCIGRGLRLWPGKENCLVLDFTDRHHILDGIMSLSNTLPETAIIEDRTKIDPEEIDRSSKIEVLDECDRVFDILGSARFIWVQVDKEWSLQDDERNEIVMTPLGENYIATIYFTDGSSAEIVKIPIPIDYCSGVCEDYARRHLKVSFANLGSSWMLSEAVPTKGQSDFLEKNGINVSCLTRGQAAIEIRKLIASKNKQRRIMSREPITPKQKYLLVNNGIDPTNLNKLTAMKTISVLKNKTTKMTNNRF